MIMFRTSNINVIESRLIDVSLWVLQRIDVGLDPGSLRSPELQIKNRFFPTGAVGISSKSFDDWYDDQVQKNIKEIDKISLTRSMLLENIDKDQRKKAMANLKQGRLLLFDPFYATGDGLSHGNSDGFFGKDDAPPWDTFVYYSWNARENITTQKSMLSRSQTSIADGIVCWIPPQFIEVADAGVKCSIGAVTWLQMPIPEIRSAFVGQEIGERDISS